MKYSAVLRPLGLVLLASVLLASCGMNKSRGLVIQFLMQENGVSKEDVELEQLSDPAPWTAKDSLKLVQADFDQRKLALMSQLDTAIVRSDKAIAHAEKAMASGLEVIVRMAEETIADAQATKRSALEAKSALQGSYENTTLAEDYKEIEAYRSRGDEMIGYLVSGKAKVRSKLINFVVLTNADQTGILYAAQQAL